MAIKISLRVTFFLFHFYRNPIDILECLVKVNAVLVSFSAELPIHSTNSFTASRATILAS